VLQEHGIDLGQILSHVEEVEEQEGRSSPLSAPPTPPRTDPPQSSSSIWRRERPSSPSGLCLFTGEDDCDCADDNYDIVREARQEESPCRRVSKVIVVYFDRGDGDA